MILFLIFIFFVPKLASAQNQVCGKSWAPVTESGDTLQGNQIIHPVVEANNKFSRYLTKDSEGKQTGEVILPRTADQLLSTDPLKEGVMYKSDGKYYFYNPATKKETEISIETKNANDYVSFWANGDGRILQSSTEKKVIFDTKTQESISIGDAKTISNKGSTVFWATDSSQNNTFTKAKLYDFSTKKEVEFNFSYPANSINFEQENQITIYPVDHTSGSKDHLIRGRSGWTRIHEEKERQFGGVLSNGELLFVNIHHKSGNKNIQLSETNFKDFVITTDVMDSTGKNKIDSIDGWYTARGPIISKVNIENSQVTTSIYKETAFRSLLNGGSASPELKTTGYINLSDKNNWVIASDPTNDQVTIKNISTGKTATIPSSSQWFTPKESEDGKKLYFWGNTESIIFDSTNDQHTSVPSYLSLRGDANFNRWLVNRNGYYERPVQMCIPTPIKILTDDCNCLLTGTGTDDQPKNVQLQQIKEIAVATLCQAQFDSAQWDKITPPIKTGEMSEKMALLYLKRFEKTGGFDKQKHLAILGSILNSDIPQKYPSNVEAALQTLAVNDPLTTRTLYRFFRLDTKIPQTGEEALACKSESEKSALKNIITTFKQKATYTENNKTSVEDWLVYKPFWRELKALPKEEKENLIDGVAESLSQAGSTTEDLNGLFQSKLYYFSKKWAMGLFGEKPKDATDFAVAIRNGKSIPIILASGQLNSATKPTNEFLFEEAPYGFQYKVLPPFLIPEKSKVGDEIKKDFAWSYNGEKYTAETKLKVLEPLASLIPKDKSPNYSAMKKDGKFSGMMVVGSSLSHQAGLVDGYLTYYQNEGFEFGPPKTVSTIDFFKDKVQSGEIKYLIKESHSDGDEKNLFRANKTGKLLEGVKKGPNGLVETIYLLGPEEDKPSSGQNSSPVPQRTALISNQEFGRWVRSRPKETPLVYFNGSCNSVRKVLAEVAASHSSNFIPIATASSVYTFSDSEKNGTRQMIDAFRKGRDYEGIRAALKKSEHYGNQSGDVYIFPDEKEYDARVRKNLKMNIDVETDVKDKNGNILNIDENVDH